MVARLPVWTTPITWDDNQELDEDTLNEQIRNNLLFLKEGHFALTQIHPDDGIGPFTHGAGAGLWEEVDSVVAVTLTLETAANLFLGFNIPLLPSGSNRTMAIDFFDGTNYASSQTPTPDTDGIAFDRWSSTANFTETASMMLHLGPSAAGTYTYTMWWNCGVNGGYSLPLDVFPMQLWLMGM